MELILQNIADMQDKINSNTDSKLENYVTIPKFNDLELLQQSNQRRISHNDQLLKDVDQKAEKALAMFENLRKQLQRLQQEVDALSKKTSSAMSNYEPPAEEQIVVKGEGSGDGAGVEKLHKLILRI